MPERASPHASENSPAVNARAASLLGGRNTSDSSSNAAARHIHVWGDASNDIFDRLSETQGMEPATVMGSDNGSEDGNGAGNSEASGDANGGSGSESGGRSGAENSKVGGDANAEIGEIGGDANGGNARRSGGESQRQPAAKTRNAPEDARRKRGRRPGSFPPKPDRSRCSRYFRKYTLGPVPWSSSS